MEVCQAQPLPLTLEFQRTVQLLDGLLREEAFAFKILLADSQKPRSDDLQQAMQALARQAEVCLHGYKNVPEALMLDAHQLYVLAKNVPLDTTAPSDELIGAEIYYRYLLLLSMVDSKQHRAKQVQLLFDYLRDNAECLQLLDKRPDNKLTVYDFALNSNYGSRPVPAAAIIHPDQDNVIWLNISQLINSIDEQIHQKLTNSSTLLGAESLERQSLVRLRVDLAKSRRRRATRKILFEPYQVCIGHKSISSQLHFESTLHTQTNLDDNLPDEFETHAPWVVCNETAQGVALFNSDCRSGLVQVGDLVSIKAEDEISSLMPKEKATVKSTALLGIIRWLGAGKANSITMGVEYLAKGILPVAIVRTDSGDDIDSDALIVACKVKNSVLQTILLPAYLYQPGDRLTIKLNGKSRNLQLHQTLQSNGLFSHYSLKDG